MLGVNNIPGGGLILKRAGDSQPVYRITVIGNIDIHQGG